MGQPYGLLSLYNVAGLHPQLQDDCPVREQDTH